VQIIGSPEQTNIYQERTNQQNAQINFGLINLLLLLLLLLLIQN